MADFTRGDDYTLSISVTDMSFSWDSVTDIRIALKQANYTAIKTMKAGQVTLDKDTSTISFTLTHVETINLRPSRLKMQMTFVIDDKIWTNPTVTEIAVHDLLNDGVIDNA